MANVEAAINVVVKGTSAVNQLLQNVGQLQGIVDRINSTPLNIAEDKLQRNINNYTSSLKGLEARMNDISRGEDAISKKREAELRRLTNLQQKQNEELDKAQRLRQGIGRRNLRPENQSKTYRDLSAGVKEAERSFDALSAKAADAKSKVQSLGEQLSASIQRTISRRRSFTASLIDAEETIRPTRAIARLTDELLRYGDSLKVTRGESTALRTLPNQIKKYQEFQSELDRTTRSVEALKSELESLGAVEKMRPVPLGKKGIKLEQENTERANRNARREQLSSEIKRQEPQLARLESRIDELGPRILANQRVLQTAQRVGTKQTGLGTSLNQLQAQAEALALVANNSQVASAQFNQFAVAAEATAIKLSRAQQRSFAALAAGFSSQAQRTPAGLGSDQVAGSRSLVAQAIADIPSLTRSEAALSQHISLLTQLKSIVPFLGDEYTVLSDSIERLNNELQDAQRLGAERGAGAGAARLTGRTVAQQEAARAQGPISLLPQFSIESDAKRLQFNQKLEDSFREQVRLSEKIESSSLDLVDKQRLRLQAERAYDTLADTSDVNRIQNSKKIVAGIKDEITNLADAARARKRISAEEQTVSALTQRLSQARGRVEASVGTGLLSEEQGRSLAENVASAQAAVDERRLKLAAALTGEIERQRVSGERVNRASVLAADQTERSLEKILRLFNEISNSSIDIGKKDVLKESVREAFTALQDESSATPIRDAERILDRVRTEFSDVKGKAAFDKRVAKAQSDLDKALKDFDAASQRLEAFDARAAFSSAFEAEATGLSSEIDNIDRLFESIDAAGKGFTQRVESASKARQDFERAIEKFSAAEQRLEAFDARQAFSSAVEAEVSGLNAILSGTETASAARAADKDFKERLQAASDFRTTLLDLQKLEKSYQIQAGRGVEADQEREKLTRLIQANSGDIVDKSRSNVEAMKLGLNLYRKSLDLRVLEAKLADQYQTPVSQERIDFAKSNVLSKALDVQKRIGGLEALGIDPGSLQSEIDQVIKGITGMGDAGITEVGRAAKQVLDISNKVKEVSLEGSTSIKAGRVDTAITNAQRSSETLLSRLLALKQRGVQVDEEEQKIRAATSQIDKSTLRKSVASLDTLLQANSSASSLIRSKKEILDSTLKESQIAEKIKNSLTDIETLQKNYLIEQGKGVSNSAEKLKLDRELSGLQSAQLSPTLENLNLVRNTLSEYRSLLSLRTADAKLAGQYGEGKTQEEIEKSRNSELNRAITLLSEINKLKKLGLDLSMEEQEATNALNNLKTIGNTATEQEVNRQAEIIRRTSTSIRERKLGEELKPPSVEQIEKARVSSLQDAIKARESLLRLDLAGIDVAQEELRLRDSIESLVGLKGTSELAQVTAVGNEIKQMQQMAVELEAELPAGAMKGIDKLQAKLDDAIALSGRLGSELSQLGQVASIDFSSEIQKLQDAVSAAGGEGRTGYAPALKSLESVSRANELASFTLKNQKEEIKNYKEIESYLAKLQTLQNNYGIEEKKGVAFGEEKLNLQNQVNSLSLDSIGINRTNVDALKQLVGSYKDYLDLRISEAKLAGTYKPGKTSAGLDTPEKIEKARSQLLGRALSIQGQFTKLESEGASITNEKLQAETAILRLKELQGKATKDEVELIAQQLLDISNIGKEIKNAMPGKKVSGFSGAKSSEEIIKSANRIIRDFNAATTGSDSEDGNTASSFIDNLKSGASSAVAAATQFAEAAKKAIEETFDTANPGDNIVSTFAHSLKDGASSAAAAATAFTEAGKKAIKKALGISSPSKFILIEIVGNIVSTWQDGLARSAGKIRAAFEKAFTLGQLDFSDIQKLPASVVTPRAEPTDTSERLAAFTARTSSNPSFYRKLAAIIGGEIVSSPAITEATYRKTYERGGIVSPTLLPVEGRRFLRGTPGIPGSGLEPALFGGAIGAASRTGAFVDPIASPRRLTTGVSSAFNPAIAGSMRPSVSVGAPAGLFDVQAKQAQAAIGSVYSMVGKSTFKDFSARASKITAASIPTALDDLKQSLSILGADLSSKVKSIKVSAADSIEKIGAFADDIASLGRAFSGGPEINRQDALNDIIATLGPTTPTVSRFPDSAVRQLNPAEKVETTTGSMSKLDFLARSTSSLLGAQEKVAEISKLISKKGSWIDPSDLVDVSKAISQFESGLGGEELNKLRRVYIEFFEIPASFSQEVAGIISEIASGMDEANGLTGLAIEEAETLKDQTSELASSLLDVAQNLDTQVKTGGSSGGNEETIRRMSGSTLGTGSVSDYWSEAIADKETLDQEIKKSLSGPGTEQLSSLVDFWATASEQSAKIIEEVMARGGAEQRDKLAEELSRGGFSGAGDTPELDRMMSALEEALNPPDPFDAFDAASAYKEKVRDSLNSTASDLSSGITDAADTAVSEGQSEVKSAIRKLFDRISESVRKVLPGMGGGGGGGRGPGGSSGPGGSGGSSPTDAFAGMMERVSSVSKATNEDLRKLTEELGALRDAAAGGSDEFNRLTDMLGQATREEERRDPNADSLTRMFGPRAAAGISEGLIGGAFPLLFGQGLGASLGGLTGGGLGGFVGGNLGFGLSLLGTGLGSVFDQLSQAAQDTGKALNSPIESFDKLKEAAIFASDEQEYHISKLIESGRTAEATAQIQAEVIKKIGVTGVNDLMRLGDASSDLSDAWAEFNLQLQAALAGPMAGLLEWVTSIVKIQNESFRSEQLVKDVSSGLTGKTREKFLNEILAIDLKESRPIGGISKSEASKQRAALAEFYKSLANMPQAKQPDDSPEQRKANLDKQMENAQKIRDLNRRGEDLERRADEMRRSNEETIYGLRKRATEMEREAAEYRRSLEDKIIDKRMELERSAIDLERKRSQLAIDSLDAQLNQAKSGMDPIASGIVDAARAYLRTRSEGEADLQANEKRLKLEIEKIERDTARFKIEVEDRVRQMNEKRDEFTREVSKAKFQMAIAEGEYLMQVEDYRYEQTRRRVELALQEKEGITKAEEEARQGGLVAPNTVDGFPVTDLPGWSAWRGRTHKGVDVGAPTGTALGYEQAGKVLFAGTMEGYGKMIKVALDDGAILLAAHLNEVFVKANQRFTANQRLATIGSTGLSTGPHLHHEGWMNGKADPVGTLDYVQLGKALQQPTTAARTSGAQPSVTQALESLRKLTRQHESYGGNYGAFNRGGRGRSPQGSGIDPNLTSMTIAEILRRQSLPVGNSGRFHAVGADQITKGTLEGLLAGRYGDTGVKSSDKFSPQVQDKLWTFLARNRIVQGNSEATRRGFLDEWTGLEKADRGALSRAVSVLAKAGPGAIPIARPAARGGATPVTPAGAAAAGAAMTPPAAPILPPARPRPNTAALTAMPRTPGPVGYGDLTQKYEGLNKQSINILKEENGLTREQNRLKQEQALLNYQQQVVSPISRFREQNRELDFEVETREKLNKLVAQGVDPAIIEGRKKIIELERTLNTVLSAQDQVARSEMKNALAMLNINSEMINSTFELTDASIKELAVKAKTIGKENELLAVLQEILDRRNMLRKASKGEADLAATEIGTTAGKSVKTPGQKIQGRIDALKTEMKDLVSIDKLAITSADNIGNAFGGAFRDIITGASSTQEALAGFFKNVADGFAAMAAEIIAKQMTMIILQTILKALGATAGGASSGPNIADIKRYSTEVPISPGMFGGVLPNANGNIFEMAGLQKFANGGAFTNSIISSPTLFQFADGGVMKMGVMGEAGDEAVMPLERDSSGRLGVRATGLAVPFAQAPGGPVEDEGVPFRREAMGLTVPFMRDGSGSGDDQNAPASIDVRFETVSIGGMDVVTREEAQKIGQEAAQRGAELAHKRYRNNPSARRAAGFS